MHQFFNKKRKDNFQRTKMKVIARWNRSAKIIAIPSMTDPFGNIIFLKRTLTRLIGMATYRRFNVINKTEVEGAEYLSKLPETNVLFVSNHQTYYADVMALYHIFASVKWGFKNMDSPIYLLHPKAKVYYIAAEETMYESGLLPKIFSYAGAVTVKRSWRHKGKDVKRSADYSAPEKIKKALSFGWVINFPQGTTKAKAPIQKGTAKLIQKLRPIVVAVEIDGFQEAFDKLGLHYKKKGVKLSVKFQKPKQFDEDCTVEEIQAFLEKHILKTI